MKQAMPRPKLPKISDEMKAWSAALEREVCDWPQVKASSFFGLVAFHHKDKIFALLPRTRAISAATPWVSNLMRPHLVSARVSKQMSASDHFKCRNPAGSALKSLRRATCTMLLNG